jgi:transposase InsO family protein
MRYGPSSTWKRHDDRGGPSSDTAYQESLRALARRYGVNPKTIAKWKARSSVSDLPTGPREPRSTALSVEEEAVVVAFRRHTLLPLDDCLYALQPTIPHLTRSSLHRCLKRHGISRLPQVESEASPKRKFKAYPIGFFHVDIAEVQTAQGKLYLFVAIDRASKFAVAQLVDKATARAFLERLVAAVPYRVEIVLTDNGIQFADLPKNRSGPTARLRRHPFDRACREHRIEHRLTKPNHPWTNGQVERMNRTIKHATVKRYHYESHDQLVRHLADFLAAYNFARRLKTLNGLTRYEFVRKRWTTEPERFRLNPLQQMPGLNKFLIARFGRDDLNLDRRRPEPSKFEAPATGLVYDLRTVCCDVAQGVDLIVMLPIGKGGDFGEQGFERAPRHSIREAHQAVVEAE